MPFYTESSLDEGALISLEGAEQHHLFRVLRKTEGEEIDLVNGRGMLARAKILEVKKEKSTLRILSLKRAVPLSPQISLAIPLMRPSKLEWVVEKGTELGADRFLLYCADLSEKETLSTHLLERLRTITIAALKQSGRLYLPSLEERPSLDALLLHEGALFFGDLDADTSLTPATQDLLFITGPEKGFSEREKALLLKRGAHRVRLSPFVLRAETAPLAAIAKLRGCLQSISLPDS